MEKQNGSKPVILLSGIIILLLAVIVVLLFFQNKPDGWNQQLSVMMEKEAFPEEPTIKNQTEITTATNQELDSSKGVASITTTTSKSIPNSETPPTVETSTATNLATPKVTSGANINLLPLDLTDTPTPATEERGALVENKESPWSIRDTSDKTNGEWETILVRNQNKFDYTIRTQSPTDWSFNEENKKIRVQLASDKAKGKDILSRKNEGKYAVQLLSLENEYFERAVEITRMLVFSGYYAYLYKTEQKFKDQYWYRVRVGFFKTVEEAREKGQEIHFRFRDQNVFPQDFWPVEPTSRELSKVIVDHRMWQNKPWMIELPELMTRQQAIEMLPSLETTGDFVYIAQNTATPTAIRYRVRFGFFEKKNQAKEQLKKLSEKSKLFSKSQVVKL